MFQLERANHDMGFHDASLSNDGERYGWSTLGSIGWLIVLALGRRDPVLSPYKALKPFPHNRPVQSQIARIHNDNERIVHLTPIGIHSSVTFNPATYTYLASYPAILRTPPLPHSNSSWTLVPSTHVLFGRRHGEV